MARGSTPQQYISAAHSSWKHKHQTSAAAISLNQCGLAQVVQLQKHEAAEISFLRRITKISQTSHAKNQQILDMYLTVSQ